MSCCLFLWDYKRTLLSVFWDYITWTHFKTTYTGTLNNSALYDLFTCTFIGFDIAVFIISHNLHHSFLIYRTALMLCCILTFNLVFLHAGLSFFSRVLENCEDEARFEQVRFFPCCLSSFGYYLKHVQVWHYNDVDLRAPTHIYAKDLISLSPREDVGKESHEESACSTVTIHITFSPVIPINATDPLARNISVWSSNKPVDKPAKLLLG